jgi:cytochrome c
VKRYLGRRRRIESAALLLAGAAALVACSPTPRSALERGQELFQRKCSVCHTLTTRPAIGPGLAGLFDPGGPALPKGVDYGGKLPNGRLITEGAVAAWIDAGGRGQIGLMPPQNLTDQQIADVIAYLKTTHK